MILALDIATNCGWACGGPKYGSPLAGTLRLPQDLDRALVSLRESVTMICRANTVERVVIESLMKRVNRKHSIRAFVVLASLQAVAREAATRCGAKIDPVDGVDVRTWRKTFLGNGNLSTEDAKNGAMKRCAQLGWRVDGHDAAEACGILYHVMAEKYPRWSPRKIAA